MLEITKYILLLFFIISNILSASKVEARVDDDLSGAWIKKNTGEIINFRKDNVADISLSKKYNDIKNINFVSCTKYGGNLCFKNKKLQCSYKYSFIQGVLNLQYRFTEHDNISVCMSLYGDYTRVDK